MNLSKDVRDIVEVEIACSLPICNEVDEITYCYSIRNLDERRFFISRIIHVFCRKRGSDEILEMEIEKYFSPELLNEIVETSNQFKEEDDYIVELYDEYMERYEEFCGYCYKNQINDAQKYNNRRMLQLLEKMFDGTIFLKIHYHLGKDMMAYLKQ